MFMAIGTQLFIGIHVKLKRLNFILHALFFSLYKTISYVEQWIIVTRNYYILLFRSK
jgi:phage shock protein PspC (stress-responsive transcriptional regulator)